MEPTLVHGQAMIGVWWPRVRPGELRVFEHPARADFWLVKRVATVDAASMIVASDNADAPAVDSRSFGPVDTQGSYRVVWTSKDPI